MRGVVELLRRERSARLFFLALTQSALGTGAGYVALLLIAYDRYRSPWSITLILLADLLPAMLLGPVFGAAADRWSRRGCMVVADGLRAAAFLAIPLVSSFEATLLLALVAGIGTGLFPPAALAALPSLVEPQRIPAATSLYGLTADLGFTVGPALAAVVLLFASPENLTSVNGLTFAVSALILARLRFGALAPGTVQSPGGPLALLRDARDGLGALAAVPGARAVVAGSGTALFCGGLFNVAELPFAYDEMGASSSGYAALVAAFGIGFAGGSLSGAPGGGASLLKQRFLVGLLVDALGILACAAAPTMVVAVLAFAMAGVGNGTFLVHERVILQETVPERFRARAFGVKNAVGSWGFGVAFLLAGALLTTFGTRAVFAMAGVGALVAAALTALALRSRGHLEPASAPPRSGEGGGRPRVT